MIANLHNLKPGSILFFRYQFNFISWIISWLSGFKYSHIAIYVGNNKVLESCYFGLKSRQVLVQKYLNNPLLTGEVITIFSEAEDIKLFLNRIKRFQKEKNSFIETIKKALFGLDIEVIPETKKITIQDIYKKVTKII